MTYFLTLIFSIRLLNPSKYFKRFYVSILIFFFIDVSLLFLKRQFKRIYFPRGIKICREVKVNHKLVILRSLLTLYCFQSQNPFNPEDCVYQDSQDATHQEYFPLKLNAQQQSMHRLSHAFRIKLFIHRLPVTNYPKFEIEKRIEKG